MIPASAVTRPLRALAATFALAALTLAGCASDDGEQAPSCEYEKPQNPAGCPAGYSISFSGRECPLDGLGCRYPGWGDGSGRACDAATAVLECRRSLESDGGPAKLEWIASQ